MFHLSVAFAGRHPRLTPCPLVILTNPGSYGVASQIGEANLPGQWSAISIIIIGCALPSGSPSGEQSDPRMSPHASLPLN